MLSNQSILILLSWNWCTRTCCGKWNQIRWLYSKFLKCVLLWAAVWYDARDYFNIEYFLMIQCQWLNRLVFISVSPCAIEIWIKDLKGKKKTECVECNNSFNHSSVFIHLTIHCEKSRNATIVIVHTVWEIIWKITLGKY